MSLSLLHDQSCILCPALVASRSRIVHGYGDPKTQIVFVGEAPGRHGADRTGIPFSGDKSGRILQQILLELDLMDAVVPGEPPQLRCFITNVVRCCPPANRTPTPSEQRHCEPFLAHELDQIDPWLIVPVGRLALQPVAMRYLGYAPSTIRGLHATILRADTRVIVPLIHPARISHAQIAAFVAVMGSVLEQSPTARSRL